MTSSDDTPQPPGSTPATTTAAAETQPQPTVPPATMPPAPPQAAVWPPVGQPAGVAPRPPRGAWIRALTPVTAAVLSGLLLLAGFGIGVVVGWQHDGGGDQHAPAGFSKRDFRDGMQPGQRSFGPGHGFGRLHRQGQPGQQPNLPGQPRQLPSPSPSTTS